MKPTRALPILAFIIGSLFIPSSGLAAEHVFVAKNGNDAWSGMHPQPNADGTDGPFATLERAISMLHARAGMRDSSRLSTAHPGVIEVRAGRYEIASALAIRNCSHIILRSYKKESVTLSGSVPLTKWNRITDPGILALIPEALRDSVVEIDLKENGIDSAGALAPRGSPGLQLFIDGRAEEIVRYPATGWLQISDVPQWGDSLYNKGLDREKRYNNVPVGRHYGRIQYNEDRISRWSPRNELFMQGYWTWDWSDSYQMVDHIIPERREIVIRPPHHWYGYTKNQRYCFYNMLEELARPGQWCISRQRGKLYVYLPSGGGTASTPNGHTIRASRLDAPLLTIENSADILIEGFTIEESRNSGIVIKGGSDVVVERCRMHDLGNCAIVIEGGSGNGIRSSELFDLALGAVALGGGDRMTLTAARNFCDDTHIHHFSRWLRTGQYAVNLSGVGNRISHTVIHDAPFEAVYLSGNDHTVEYNEIHHVTQETGDAGALHTGRDWTWRGNRIQYNYFHHLQGSGLHGVMGVYLDDWASGFVVKGNIFYKAGRATLIGGGRDNLVENNIYIECAPSIHIDARGLGWGGYYFDGTYPDLFTKMDAVGYSRPPYSTRYPALLTLYADEPAVPKHNIVRRNISYGGRWMDVYDYQAFDLAACVSITHNVIADTAVMRRRSPGGKGWDPYYLNIDTKEGYDLLLAADRSIRRELHGNLFIAGDPGFVDRQKGDFRVKKNSPAFMVGFEPIPWEKIGLRTKRF